MPDPISAGALALIIRSETLRPAIRDLVGPVSHETGKILGHLAHFVERRTAKLLKRVNDEIPESLDKKLLELQEVRKASVQRTIFEAALSSGEDTLEYWAKLLKKQATAPSDTDADLAESLVGALKEMTDTHVHALIKLAAFVRLKRADEDFSDAYWAQFSAFDLGDSLDSLHPMPSQNVQLIQEDLLRIGLLVDAETNMGFKRNHVSKRGLDLLMLGEWQPFVLIPWWYKLDYLARDHNCRYLVATSAMEDAFRDVQLLIDGDRMDAVVRLNGGSERALMVTMPSGEPKTRVIVTSSEGGLENAPTGALEAVKKAMRTRSFYDFVAPSAKFSISVTRVSTSDELQVWRVVASEQEECVASLDVEISPWLFKEMDELANTNKVEIRLV